MNNCGYEPWMIEEIKKCRKSFSYFTQKYVKIIHPMKGLIPFQLYPFQERVISEYERNDYNIVKKFRQAGLTTVTVIWGLWRCLFKKGQRIMVLSKADREAIGIGKIVQEAKNNLPDWLQPEMGNDNDHEKEFKDTNSVMWFFTVEGTRSRALTYLIIDEAAFIPKMDEHWKGMYPTLSTGGKCIAISTVNGIGNWYHETWERAREKKNQFNIIDIEYTEHPDYNNPEWVRRTKANLGHFGFLQEVLGSFLGSGETYIDGNTITMLEKKCKNPIRKLFPEWDSHREDEMDDHDLPNYEFERGALWVWKEPEHNREYIIGVDSAAGGGNDADHSAFVVFESKTLEQCAEFYSNLIPVHKFAQALVQVATFYNGAMVVVEHNGPGLSVINHLQHNLYYDNIYYSQTNTRESAGLDMNKNIRPLCMEAMQTCLMNNLCRISSMRFIRELKTFSYNTARQRPEAHRGKHDDLIMAAAMALYVSDVIGRQAPIGSNEVGGAISDHMRNANTDEIKKALEEGLPQDFFDDLEEVTHEELLPRINGKIRRPMDSLLRSFGF